jgi:hypothetical protein
MSSHPLLELANDSNVKTPATFREAANALTADEISSMYEQERAAIAEEVSADIQHFADHDPPAAAEPTVDEHEFAVAVINQCQDDQSALVLADGVAPSDPDDVDDEGVPPTHVDLIDHAVNMTTLAPRKIKARNRVLSSLDLLGVSVDDRITVQRVRLMPPGSTKGDTPLRAIVEGLAQCAAVDAYRETLSAQIEERTGRVVSADPPRLVLFANNRYWEIYRRRSLKSAGPWMEAMRRIAAEIEQGVGIPVRFASVKLYGDPPWRMRHGRPLLASDVVLRNGLEPVGNELKPKSKARQSAKDSAVIEANLERMPVPYSVRDSYLAGDRISHPKLGEGVVQKSLGPTKVEVRFGEEVRVLVQGRG